MLTIVALVIGSALAAVGALLSPWHERNRVGMIPVYGGATFGVGLCLLVAAVVAG